MKKATLKDLDAMIDVLSLSFTTDPHVSWFIGNPASPARAEKKRRVLMEYLCTAAISCGQAWTSDDAKAVALWQQRGDKPSGGAFLRANLKYLFTCGLKSTIKSLEMEKRAASHFPPGPYLFLWTIGIHPEARGKGLFRPMVAPVLKEAEEKGWPVLLETTVPRNVEIYTHYGFKTVDHYTWTDSPEVTVMRKG